MAKRFTLEYWREDNWYIGRLREVPGVFSQGESLEELEENVKDAYRMMAEEEPGSHPEAHTKELEIET
ncbi:MAG: type II toxin-antitoxin system HicB family antitoxin [Deltaproteobacteria bacterium]|nr:type II toxin-antitoxin system HicB family antitoxin [Deltaproteobacteria bacterium]